MMNTKRRRDWGASTASAMGSTINNKKSALSAAYAELGKELTSGKLRSVGTYTLGRPIGEGTYGKVRLGTHRLSGTRVAIKQVPKAHSANLTREIHHHRRLHHPNVMQLYEVLATESYIWMVTELCAGGELYDYLVERGTMPEPEARRIFGQLCLAVAYVHERGIVHRDLKLENVLLDERCNVKLGDFGFTREFEANKLMETFCGTTGYAAPEMLAGRRYLGEEVDVWSLGVILYALVCGALPFDDDDEAVMKAKILQGQYELPDALSDDCKDLISSILQQDPSTRPTIKQILSHSWFTKLMLPLAMATVDEVVQDAEPDATLTTEEIVPAETSKSASNLAPMISDSEQVRSPSAIDGGNLLDPLNSDELTHKTSSSGLSSGSFFSARSKSDSESSDRRSSDTQTTNPTTDEADQEGMPALKDIDANIQGKGDDEEFGTAPLSWKHRNESQTTIKRQASAGSDASRVASSKAASTPLPTHVESSKEPDLSDDKEDKNDVGEKARGAATAPALLMSTPLEPQRSSQSISRVGHHRTPSRTKRRSSGGLSDHRPPSLEVKPVDYVAQLALSSAALFSTIVEQNLLHQLSMLGMDVGQIVHSVVNEACDASGAMWWILKKKAEERAAQHDEEVPGYFVGHGSASVSATPHAPTFALSRGAEAASRSRKDSNPTQHSHSANVGENRMSPTLQRNDLIRPTPINPTKTRPVQIDDLTAVDEAMPPGFAESGRETSSTAHDANSAVSHSQTTTNAHTNRGNRPSMGQSRIRASSFSARISSVLAGKDVKRDFSGGEENSITIGNEQFELEERSKSPVVGALFSKIGGGSERNTPSPVASPAKQKKKEVRSPLQRNATAPPGTREEEKIKHARKDDQGSPSSSTPPKKTERDASVGSASRLHQTKSFETFSTISSATNADSTSGSAEKGTIKAPGRTGKSSFLHTVRNWLGADEKDKSKSAADVVGAGGKGTVKAKKKKNRRSVQQASTGTVKRAPSVQGMSSVSPTATRTGSIRRMHAPPSAYPPGSLSRPPRVGSRSTSISRRSSSGSVQYPALANVGVTPQRPMSIRRPSAGSITPTATAVGGEEYLFHQVRNSRPSSAQSFHRSVPGSGGGSGGGLHAKSGSTGSSTSFARMQSQGSGYSGSLRGIHAHRASIDGGTTVRRHRHYPSHGHNARSESGSVSRPSTPSRAGMDETSLDTVTPRRSFDSNAGGRASPMQTPRASQSVFVAHRSRTPYKPPSANPALLTWSGHHGAHSEGHTDHEHYSTSQHGHGRPLYYSSGGLHHHHPPLGTWRRSWGKPPPSWSGPVDQAPPSQSSTDKAAKGGLMDEDASGKPKLRDVFANRESDDDWEDEDDEPTYAGGLGQLASSTWGVDVGQTTQQQQNALPVTASSWKGQMSGSKVDQRPATNEAMPSMLLTSGRYAGNVGGMRGLFQPPSLGRETMPRSWVSSITEDTTKGSENAEEPSGDSSGKATRSPTVPHASLEGTSGSSVSAGNGNANIAAGGAVEAGSATVNTPASNVGSRIRSAAPTFKGPVTIEEEEEDE